MTATLEVVSLSKRFGPVEANRDISLSVDAGELLCLFGENGAGKSTLSACLAGILSPDAGRIVLEGEVVRLPSAAEAINKGIGLVHQHFNLVPDFTVLENIVVGAERGFTIRREAAEAKLQAICRSYGIRIDPRARVADLSVGERQWVELLKALYFDARVLILDEPTAALDLNDSRALFRIVEKLKADGVALILITHKLDEVMRSDRVAVLRRGRIVGERRTAETTAEELTRMMVGRAIAPPARKARVPGEARLELDNVTLHGEGAAPELDGISLAVRAGEIFGIAGVAGNGQSALMETLAGVRRPDSGRVLLDGEEVGGLGVRALMARGVGHIPEDRFGQGLVPDFSIAENLILGRHRDAFAAGPFIDRAAMERRAREDMEAFGISAPSPQTLARRLSGGNAQRVVLARELRLADRVLLANQPTRGLDVGVIEYIHAQLLAKREAGVAILWASTEMDDLLALSDRIGVMFAGRLMGVLDAGRFDLDEIGLLMSGRRTERAA